MKPLGVNDREGSWSRPGIEDIRGVLLVAECDSLMPSRGTPDSAGLDLRAAVSRLLGVGERALIPTGVRLALPRGYEAQVRPRSGFSFRGIDVPVGTIDSDYRGDVGVILVNNTGAELQVSRGDRIAQLVICQLATIPITRVATLDEDTVRGIRGFGSTGTR